MNVTTVGRGNIGGGLARLWERAGHDVTTLGQRGRRRVRRGRRARGGAVGGDLRDALAKVTGLDGKTAIDATNAFAGPQRRASSRSRTRSRRTTNGPVAKAFNANFAVLYDQIARAARSPGCLYAADDEAREVTEQLIRDAGYEPVSAGGLENARALEDFVPGLLGKIGQRLLPLRAAGRALAREQRQLHAVGRLDARVAVAPGRRHRRCDLLAARVHEPPRRLVAVGHLEREPDRSGHSTSDLDRRPRAVPGARRAARASLGLLPARRPSRSSELQSATCSSPSASR